MSARKGQFQVGNTGRPKGSKNRKPSVKELNQLLNMITSDLILNYDLLNTNEKIRILHSFARKYTDNDNVIELTDFKFKFDS